MINEISGRSCRVYSPHNALTVSAAVFAMVVTAIQLAGIAALQNGCPLLEQVERSSMSELNDKLQQAEAMLSEVSVDRPLQALSLIDEALPPVMHSLSILASAASTAVFTQTPDGDCTK
ncbi:hypothetical protein DUNSADRAFT_16160 [Dunaliella salina]|uniref:Uncharacterized protein n=1 Tax=Dunaliella salina TaxID=3046 RepID=A0ABQ7G448_DUNSA|nr:hypothetical protein DUNSADRAFT_16160 [Dunaliella salina]|eukprot:KAF5829391.1 hypothetical protein DUNSADRAFT_16160 [Dunaliella salina]